SSGAPDPRLELGRPDSANIQQIPRYARETGRMSTPTNGTAEPEARLLVVEDEPNIRELLATSLRFAGFEVEVASTGAEAIAAARRNHPDLCVLDVMLP